MKNSYKKPRAFKPGSVIKLKPCELCGGPTASSVKIYDPRNFTTFDDCNICVECEDEHLEMCSNCGKQIYSTDIAYTDWHSATPYDNHFESVAMRDEIISEWEAEFYCNLCFSIGKAAVSHLPN